MTSFTLDSNCLIDVEKNEPGKAEYIIALADAHAAGRADVAISATSGAEKQTDKIPIDNFSQFENRLARAGLGHLNSLPSMTHLGMCFLDHCILPSEDMSDLEHSIHLILFPNLPYSWEDFCAENGHDLMSSDYTKWHNCKCDVEIMWGHIYGKRDVFVTSDGNFHKHNKKKALIALGAGRIEHPCDSLQFL